MAEAQKLKLDTDSEVVNCYLQESSEDENVTINEPSDRDTSLRDDVLTILHDALGNMYRDQEFTDLEVKVEGKTFKCHKVIMAAMSGYFRSLLTSGMQESQNGHVEIKEVSKAAFNNILMYIYYGENVISARTVDDLLRASVFLQVQPLEAECVKFLSASLNPTNCIGIWKNGKALGCPSLSEEALAIILKHFDEVSRMDEFLSLDKDDVITILDDEDLNQDVEDPICDAVLEWVRKDLASREQYLEELLQYVCMPKVSGSFLYDRVFSDTELLNRSPSVKAMAMDALAYHLKPDQQMSVMSRQTKLRGEENLQKVVTLIGGYCVIDDPLKCVLHLDLKRQKWYTVAPLTHDAGQDFATCVCKNEIYVSGGSRSLDKFVKYTPGTNDWFPQPSLITGRECHAMVVIGDCIYVVGGRRSQQEGSCLVEDIEVYNTKRGTWGRVGKLQCPLENLSCAVLKDKIYTFGGTDDSGNPSSAIQCFDPSIEACSLTGSLPDPAEMTSAVVLNSKIYILTSEGAVFRFDPSASEDAVSKVAEFEARSKFGLYVDGHSLVVAGGEKSEGTLADEIFKIDIRSGKVTSDLKLPLPFGGFRMEHLVVPKEMLAQEGFNFQYQNLFDVEEEYRAQEQKTCRKRYNLPPVKKVVH